MKTVIKYFLFTAVFVVSLSCQKESAGEIDPTETDIPVALENKKMKLTIGSIIFTASLEDNTAAASFKAMLPKTFAMTDFNRNEKCCTLGQDLPGTAANSGTINAGDIMLWAGSTLVLFYETFQTSYSYVKLGKIDDVSGLKAALGSGDVSVKIELHQ